jgi:hypothetical protein
MEELTERELLMVLYYKQGMFQTQICKELHCKRETLLKVLNTHGVRILTKSERNRVVTVNPFNQLNDISDYWLGYFIADGNVSKNEHKITIVSKDLEHLSKFHSFCKNPNKINVRVNTGCGTSGFSNKSIKQYLVNIGVTPNKTFTIELNRPLNWAIIRGLFDGDGCITKRTVYLITGSLKFREQLEQFFKAENIFYTIQKHINCWKIVIRSKSLIDFGNKLYENAEICLERKYERYRPLLEQSNNDNRMNSGEVQADNPEPSYVE